MGKCPGLYCGRVFFENQTWSDCGACPRGFRVDNSDSNSKCTECIQSPTSYDWLYLGFMSFLPLIMHWFFIDMAAKERSFTKEQVLLHVSALLEVVLSAIISVLVMEPLFSFNLYSCGVYKLSDWYTLFHNPAPDYKERLHCTQEAVYPLQTIVLVFYLLCLLLMMLVRPLLNRKFLKAGKSAVYCALYFFPILTLLHAVAGGLIYYAFPYLSIVISMVSNACHYSMKIDQSMKSLLKSSLLEMKNAVIIVGHWLILAYGIVSLRQHYALLALVPFPSIFYIITVKFTDPSEFRERDERNT
ncbi:JNK1/MAPK8-associated membrane protein [Condylostylus longicornis]|uniref:JNK1/MAPK8-associated membrane protein n=1 Tax=Condylostylus longicornis TaxID=2530218 RepID=UPI00244E0069|nr:JNK1/MAPK8-associated membrane protein [Condylostylus longicornis]